jgi:tRNA(Ile)-lysidine synthase
MPSPRGLVQQLDQQLHRAPYSPRLAGGFPPTAKSPALTLIPRHARLLIAVSGGADSIALLRLLVAINRSDFWRWTLIVAHIDHGLRGPASRADARFVAALARKLHLPCVSKRLKLKPASSEDAARQARLQALAEMCRKRKCAGVVMAHHADDQAETILMRIFRGCGIDGLAGIAPQSRIAGMTIFRPLLEFRRAALRDYLRQIGQSWREDQTNATDQFLRNRLRRQVMPLLESLWPRAVEALGRLAVLAAESQELVNVGVRQYMDETPAWRHGRIIQFPRDPLRDIPPAVASEMLRQLVEAIQGTHEAPDFERLREAARILRGLHGGKTVQLGAGITLSTRGGLVRLERTPVRSPGSRRS